jgi:hypothetical protein
VESLVEGYELGWSLLVPELLATPDAVRILGEMTGVSVAAADGEAIPGATPPSCVAVATTDTSIGLEHQDSLIDTDSSIPELTGCAGAIVAPTRSNRILGDAAVPTASELSERTVANGVNGWSPGRRIGAEQ